MSAARFTAVIVDDEPLALEGVRRLCLASGLVDIVGEAIDGASGLALIERLRPQAVFLDIAMPGVSGLEVAAALTRQAGAPRVVLVTANDHFATEAFDLAVVDYVLKPIIPERLTRAIDRLAALIAADGPPTAPMEFWVPYRGTVVRLPALDILRIEAERDYVRFITHDRSFLLRATLTDMLGRLDATRFVRIHRSTIVAGDRIAGLHHVGAGAWAVIDPDGAEFPIGRSYLEPLRERFGLA